MYQRIGKENCWYEHYTSPLAGKRLGGSEQSQAEFVAAEGEGCSNYLHTPEATKHKN